MSDLGNALAAGDPATLGITNSPSQNPGHDFAHFNTYDSNGWDHLIGDRQLTISGYGVIAWGHLDGGTSTPTIGADGGFLDLTNGRRDTIDLLSEGAST